MYCARCSKHVGECTCPDIKERLASLTVSPRVALRVCKFCDEHYARCNCANPVWVVKGGTRHGQRSEEGEETTASKGAC